MLSFKQVRYFRATAETGKVSGAAAQLGISQSAITLAIKELEAQLGVTLFDRRPGGVSLTREGQHFLSHARTIEASVEDAMADMHPDRADVSGTVRLGMTNASAGYFMVPPIARFRRANPKVSIELVESDRPGLEAAVLEGRVDLGLILTSNSAESPELESRTLLSSARGLWVAPTHPLARQEQVALKDVMAHPFLLYTVDEADRVTRTYIENRGLSVGIVFDTDSVEAVRSLVAIGFGVTILSRLLYRPWSLDGGRVEWRTLTDPPPSMDIGLIWRKDHALSEAEQRLIEALADAAG
jgi:DNA-binding transcriptional LysR family regulator